MRDHQLFYPSEGTNAKKAVSSVRAGDGGGGGGLCGDGTGGGGGGGDVRLIKRRGTGGNRTQRSGGKGKFSSGIASEV